MKFRNESMSQDGNEGGKYYLEFPIDVSNVLLVDPELGRGVRVRYGYTEEGTKVRISTKTGNLIPKPIRPELKYLERIKSKTDGIKDTPPAEVLAVTWTGIDYAAIQVEFEKWAAERLEEEKYLVFKN